MLRTVLFALALFAMPASAEERRILHDGQDRRYLLEAPAGHGAAPVIVLLHGAGGTADRLRRQVDYDFAGRGWAAVYVEAPDRRWGGDGVAAWREDLGYLRAVISELATEGVIDPDQVFLAGVSLGGIMAQVVVCTAPEGIAGAAVLIMVKPERLPCPATGPVPLLFVLGTNDPIIPFQGGPMRGRGGVSFLSAEDTFAFFAARNQCQGRDEDLLADRDPDDGVRIRVMQWQGCAAPLAALIAEGGGHTVPGTRRRPGIGHLVGPTGRDISAVAEVVAFFEALSAR